jgi:DNA polymerase-4
MTAAARTILHVDLDAFFAAVEQRDRPELRGKPVLVGGSRERGVVAAASYEARRFGIASAMPMAEALRRCPEAIVVGHDWPRYSAASAAFFAILGDFTPLVESLSVDEAFLDVTGSRRLFGDGPTIAQAIKDRVRAEIGLVASVGVAPTKFAAKVASDIDKPDGLVVVEPGGLFEFLHPLPVSRLWGVGAVTRGKLEELGLRTIGAVSRFPAEVLSRRLGPSMGQHLSQLARGEDGREISTEHQPVTIGHEETFAADVGDAEPIRARVIAQAEKVAARLRGAELRARVVVLKIKYADFHLISRRRTLADPTSDGRVIAEAACDLLAGVEIHGRAGKRRRVRLCGVAAAGLEGRFEPRQLTLDEDRRARGERLGDALDRIRGRFGDKVIGRALRGDD